MPWQNQGGGGGPWGGGGGSGGGGPSPWGRGGGGIQPPDLEELIRKGQDRFKKLMPGGGASPRAIALIVLVGIAVWLANGFYRVQPEEQGVAMIFGRWVNTTQPGLNYNLPAPIGHVEKPQVTRLHRVEVGFRAAGATGATGRGAARSDVSQESLMLTGDENIIDIQFVVFWRIKDAGEYLFNIRNPEQTVKNAAEAAMREVVGKSNFEFARTQGRGKIQDETRTLIQHILDAYGSGILVAQVEMQKVDPPRSVIDAFRDVQARAPTRNAPSTRRRPISTSRRSAPRARWKKWSAAPKATKRRASPRRPALRPAFLRSTSSTSRIRTSQGGACTWKPWKKC